jgi:hypothetical protein
MTFSAASRFTVVQYSTGHAGQSAKRSLGYQVTRLRTGGLLEGVWKKPNGTSERRTPET